MRLRLESLNTLVASPDDAELFDVFARLRDRGFLAPAPLILPAGSPDAVARALTRRSPDELATLAASIVALPDPSSPDAPAIAELFIAANDPRAERLLERFPNGGWSTLARLRRLLSQAPAPDLETLLSWSRSLSGLTVMEQAEGLSRLIAAALPKCEAHGAGWLVPVDGGRFIANLVLSTRRRPALATALGDLIPRLITLLPALSAAGHPLAERELSDRNTRLEEVASWSAFEPGDSDRVQAARSQIMSGANQPLPALVFAPLLPDTDLEQALMALAGDAKVAPSLIGGAIRERLGDKAGAAKTFAALATQAGAPSDEALSAARAAVRLMTELDFEAREALLVSLKQTTADLEDELVLLASQDAATRAELVHRLSPDPFALVRLHSSRPAAPITTPTVADSDHHHPANRLAAASDLLAEGRIEPAANILAALIKKAELGTPERLFAVVASALEHDEPPDELLMAARRALEDTPRAHRLIAALRRSPTAAFALHEELLGLAKDPSRPDPLRLAALESWLHIWAATSTPPNPDLLATLRESEPALIAAAAIAIGAATPSGHLGDPVELLRRFLESTQRFGVSPTAWADALLALMTG